MTNKQKIEFYLSKGFAVEVEWEKSGKVKLFDIDKFGNFVGMKKGECDGWDNIAVNQAVKVTPIPLKSYEFKVGDRVMVIETGKTFEVYTNVGLNGKHGDGFGNSYYWYQLAPALPEDEACEVVEVKEWNSCEGAPQGVIWEFTKPDGKKLKIKVVKP